MQRAGRPGPSSLRGRPEGGCGAGWRGRSDRTQRDALKPKEGPVQKLQQGLDNERGVCSDSSLLLGSFCVWDRGDRLDRRLAAFV